MSDEFKNDCVTFLYETLKKFDASRGSKAFSYFNVVAKNWIIVKSRQIEIVPFDIHKHDPLLTTEAIQANTLENISTILNRVKNRLSYENDKICMDCIMKLFDKVDTLESLNKRAIFVYVRDMTNLSPKQLSSSMSSIRKHYREISKTLIF